MDSEDNKREIKSFWWPAKNPDLRWFGSLHLEIGHSPRLEVFQELTNIFEGTHPPGPAIHGRTEHGIPVTLLFPGAGGKSFSIAQVRANYTAGYALIGIHLESASEFVANSLRFQVQHLYGWFGRSGFDKHFGRNPQDARNPQEFVIRFQPQEDEWFTLTSDLEIGIHHTFTTKNSFQEQAFHEDAAITFRSKSGFNLAQANRYINAIRMLIHFALLRRIYPVWITAYKNGHGTDDDGNFVEQYIEIQSSILREPKSEPPIDGTWLFRFADVQPNFADFMRTWIDYSETFAEALNAYSCTVYHPLTSQLALLILTQALEAYHGVKFSSHHKRRIQTKIEHLATSHAASLKGLIDDIPDFAERVTCTRHYYTHHNPADLSTGKVASNADLIRMNEKLRLLFQTCVLTDLGVSSERFVLLRRQLATEIIDYH